MKLVYVVIAAALLAAGPAEAQVVNMSTITCADFSSRPPEQMANIMFWLTPKTTTRPQSTSPSLSPNLISFCATARTTPRSAC